MLPTFFKGETSSGKSSIINLILGEKILPTQITSSSQKVCTIKYCERCMISTRDSKNEELDNIHFQNFNEMARQLELITDTDDAEVTYVDIYMPISSLRVRTFKKTVNLNMLEINLHYLLSNKLLKLNSSQNKGTKMDGIYVYHYHNIININKVFRFFPLPVPNQNKISMISQIW